jgi:cell division protein FtsN
MSYDLSFSRKSGTLLGVCAVVIAALLVAAGFLLGIRYGLQSPRNEALPFPVDTSSSSPAPKQGDPMAQAKAFSQPVVPVPSASSPGAVSKVDSVPASAPSHTPIPTSPAKPPNTAFVLQFGAFREKANADALLKELKDEGVPATIFTAKDQAGRNWYAVRSGAYATMTEASAAVRALSGNTRQSILVRPAHTL